jgi:hypothetical protein
MKLTPEESETHLNMTADNRGVWHVYSDDAVMQRRLEAVDATLINITPDGNGKFYELRAHQVTFRKGKRVLSDERKAELSARMRSLRSATVTTVE